MQGRHDAVRKSGEVDPIGPRPPPATPRRGSCGRRHGAALADAPIAATMRAMLPERLHGWVAEGLRVETVDQPAYVGHDLRA